MTNRFPTSAKLRNQMRAEIILLRQKINTTFIYVTHDQTEAMTLGDRIVIMKGGFIRQVGTPEDVFNMPNDLFVAEFIGAPKMNTFKASLKRADGKYYVNPYGVSIPVEGAKGEALKQRGSPDTDIILGVRPEHITLTDKNDPHGIACKVEVNEMMGSELHLHVVTENGDKLIIRVQTLSMNEEEIRALRFGQTIYFTFGGKAMHFFDAESTLNILR